MAVEVPEDAPAPGVDGDIAADLDMQISDDDDGDDTSDGEPDDENGGSGDENDDIEITEADENDDAENPDDDDDGDGDELIHEVDNDESLSEEEVECDETWLEEAEFAGGRKSQQCTLILTQGMSTSSLALNGVVSMKGWERYGVYPLVGELLNVREAGFFEVMYNPIFKTIMKTLGLELDEEFTSTESLRYGRVIIMTAEQDHYGSYIKGLLINFLHMFWPSLLKLPSFLAELIAPLIIKATKESEEGKEKRVFYSLQEYEAWRESLRGNASGWAIEKDVACVYDEGKDYFENLLMRKKDFVWVDERDDEAIELAFSKKFEVGSLQSGMHLDHEEKLVTYCDFVDKELIPFSMLAVLQRSIPSMVDGLKPHQRKVLFSSFKRDDFIKEEIVANFANYVAEHSARPVSEPSAYHRDEQSLDSTIVEMAQAYVGSNNINLLLPRGLFGSRRLGSKIHGSVHQLSTRLSPITRFLFPKDDDRLLDYLHEDGKSIEPTWYLPIIPTVLVNGSEGIGPAGWSSYIPSYNPRDIVENMKRLINDERMVPMDPWYRGFTGTIEKTVTDSGVCYSTRGIIKKEDESTLRITELPVGTCIKDYLEFLDSILEVNGEAKDHWIKDYEDFSYIDVDILIHLSDTVKNLTEASEEDLCKKFKLTSRRSISDMHLFDPKGEIKRYDTPEQILEEFFHLRLQFYEKRKTVLLLILRLELSNLENKVALMRGVLDGGVVDFNKLSTDPYLKSMPITTFVYRDSYQEKLQELLADIDRIKLKIEKLEGSTPRTLWLEELAALEQELDVCVFIVSVCCLTFSPFMSDILY